MDRERKEEEDMKLSTRGFEYFTFQKNFYVEVKERKNIKFQDVVAYRKQLELEIIAVDGKLKHVPKPIKTWTDAGLWTTFLNTIRNLNYDQVTANPSTSITNYNEWSRLYSCCQHRFRQDPRFCFAKC